MLIDISGQLRDMRKIETNHQERLANRNINLMIRIINTLILMMTIIGLKAIVTILVVHLANILMELHIAMKFLKVLKGHLQGERGGV